MKYFKHYLFLALLSIFNLSMVNAQCNTNANICQMNSGPFNFVAPGTQVSSCLDFFGPGYGYVVLYISQSGPLELLIDGDASTGYLDLAIFNIPLGIEPCDAILDVTNQISCNYATNSSGCNQIGSSFACASSVVAPNVSAGDRLMIVVENWSGSSTNFNLELAPVPAAQSGVADPTVNIVSQVLVSSSNPYQMSAVDNGGTWTGSGITADGLFDPSITGEGNFDVEYSIGSGACEVSDIYTIVVNSTLAVELFTFDADCDGNKTELNWVTLSEKNSDYFMVQFSEDGEYFETIGIVNSEGNSTTEKRYRFNHESNFVSGYYKLVEVDLDGIQQEYDSYLATCEIDRFKLHPNPVTYELFINLKATNKESVFYEIRTVSGKIIDSGALENAIDVKYLPKGIYFIKVHIGRIIQTSKFIRI